MHHVAKRYGDIAFASFCESESKKLQQQIEMNGWDGQWYRRAYFDDGSPLGSSANSECKIDSIAQSWSVLSSAAEPTRAKQAMAALYDQLVSSKDGVIKLLAPPFDKSTPYPGYIQGYLPGIRENGGQYTHGAVWAAMAFAKLGDKQRAWELFNILNPINHGRTLDEINRYKIEPYVTAGDVYSVTPHIGRGGWSWYTGSAGWLYRLVIEVLIGMQLENGNTLRLAPILPDSWNGFNLEYTYGSTVYKIDVKRVSGNSSVLLDGVTLEGNVVSLVDDKKSHQVTLNINS